MRALPAASALLMVIAAGVMPSCLSRNDMVEAPSVDGHMYEPSSQRRPKLKGSHYCIFRGQRDVTAYNNHVYLARYGGRFWALWSCGARHGGHTGQHVRYATSDDGMAWSASAKVLPAPDDRYLIARGLWVRNGELLALVARCSGQTRDTRVEALEALRYDGDAGKWRFAGVIGREIINNYPPVRLPAGEWLVPYRHRELNGVDGVLIGGVESLGAWRRVPFSGGAIRHLTEADTVIRRDGTIAVHFRDNDRSGYLYRSVSTDGGASFSQPLKTDFPDCRSKHYCFRLSSGTYILINNPVSRDALQVAGSRDGKVFTRTTVLRDEPVALRNPGHDKGSRYSYPHAIEHEGQVYVAYSVNRDDIYVTRVAIEEIEAKLGPG
jgi:hypothetical protein